MLVQILSFLRKKLLLLRTLRLSLFNTAVLLINLIEIISHLSLQFANKAVMFLICKFLLAVLNLLDFNTKNARLNVASD